MIIPPKRAWFGLLIAYRGSVIPQIRGRLLLTTLVGILVTVADAKGHHVYTLTTIPFTLIGLALGIFLGFRNNTSYDRFWEGRKLWGRLVNTSRSFCRQVLTLIEPESGEAPSEAQRTLVYRQMGYVHALRLHLRGETDWDTLIPFFGAEESARIGRSSNPPIAILQATGQMMRRLWKSGQIETYHVPVLEESLTDLADIQGGCERIRATPIPFDYTVLMHRIVAFYCFALPFGLVSEVKLMTPVVVALVAYAFLGLDAIGDEIEDPFGHDANDLPLGQLSRMIEINLRDLIGETELPEPVTPKDGILN